MKISQQSPKTQIKSFNKLTFLSNIEKITVNFLLISQKKTNIAPFLKKRKNYL